MSISSSKEFDVFDVDRRGVIDGEFGGESVGVLISIINERRFVIYLRQHCRQPYSMSVQDQQSRSHVLPDRRIYLAGQQAFS
jgi:hypothetical protein